MHYCLLESFPCIIRKDDRALCPNLADIIKNVFGKEFLEKLIRNIWIYQKRQILNEL
jgi:hypothetical protein